MALEQNQVIWEHRVQAEGKQRVQSLSEDDSRPHVNDAAQLRKQIPVLKYETHDIGLENPSRCLYVCILIC